MAQKADIQAQIDEIQAGANYTANQMRPTLTNMLDYAAAGQTPVFQGLVANGTNANTTLVLNVGVNVVITSTNTNRACKLPQPVTGQRVTVVNISALPIQVFPSNVGGQINNLPIDTPIAIPADGKPYDFICIENPLPGAWTVSAPATGQLEFDEITISHTTGSNTNAVGYSPSTITYAGAGVGVGLNGVISLTGNWVTIPVLSKITTFKCYTNVLYSDSGTPRINIAVTYGFLSGPNTSNVYTPTNVDLNAIPAFPNSWNPDYPILPAATQNTPLQVGDLDTIYVINTNPTFDQNAKIGPGQFSNYYVTFRMNIPANAITKDYKFKWFIEYF